MAPRFSLGRIVITRTALERISERDVRDALRRHVCGDWGAVDAQDAAENERSLSADLRLLSVYHANGGMKFWIITEADRSATTVLLPEDY